MSVQLASARAQSGLSLEEATRAFHMRCRHTCDTSCGLLQAFGPDGFQALQSVQRAHIAITPSRTFGVP
eukprot:1352461-Amphidinium_carterae.1